MNGRFTLGWKYKISDEYRYVKSISTTPNGKYIAVGDSPFLDDNKKSNVYLFNREGELLWKYETDSDVNSVAISADGEYIVAGSDNVYLFNREGELLWKYKVQGTVGTMSVTPDGEYIVAGSDNIYFFSRERELLWKYKVDNQSLIGLPVRLRGNNVRSVAITPDGEYIVAGIDNTYLFDKRGKLLQKCKIGKWTESVAISPDGEYIVAGSKGREESYIYLFNKKGKLLWSYWAENDIYSVFITSDGQYIVAGEAYIIGGEYIYFLNREGELLWKYKIEGIQSMSVTPDGEYIVAGSGNHIYLFVSL